MGNLMLYTELNLCHCYCINLYGNISSTQIVLIDCWECTGEFQLDSFSLTAKAM